MHPTSKRRGRPSSGTALSGAERQRRYRERQKSRHSDANTPASIPVTRNEKTGNPEHRLLFIVPSGGISNSTALAVPQLPEALQAGLVDIGSVDDGTRRAEILEHLLRTCP